MIVKKYLDVDLDGIYTTMEAVVNNGSILSEQEEELLMEKNWFSRAADTVKGVKDKAMDKMFGDKVGSSEEGGGSSTSSKFKKTSGKKDFETRRMGDKGLGSNRLPILLSIVGSSLGGLTWLMSTDWFKHLVHKIRWVVLTQVKV